jgi:hypothetical protein
MDLTTMFNAATAGRRRALIGLVLGSAVAVAQHPVRTAAKKGKKSKKACPRCTCPPPTTCPPADTCPKRTCCICTSGACRYGAPGRTMEETTAACEAVCGGAGTVSSGSPSVTGGSVACAIFGGSCVFVGCPT